VKILIDTHIFLWVLSSPEKLDEKRRYTIESRANEIFLSSMSIAELMIKHSIGKINIDFDPLTMAEKSGIEIMNLSGTDAVLLGTMPFHHKDPFDRMIIAQALTNKCPIMTDDLKFMKYECKIL
jgi:PIN domain nuclease of toxin-antitoxin system